MIIVLVDGDLNLNPFTFFHKKHLSTSEVVLHATETIVNVLDPMEHDYAMGCQVKIRGR